MADLITASLLVTLLAGACYCLMGYFAVEEEPGKAVIALVIGILLTILGVFIIDGNYRKVPINTTEPARIDTTIVYRNGTQPDTTYTYTFNPETRD